MARWREFRQVDVFTTTAYAGNPLVVILDADGLDAGQMQDIAAEMNLSETSFVLPPTAQGAGYAMRIFTPTHELPFAGHPSVGTAFVLHEEGRFGTHAKAFTVRQQVSIGVLPIEIDPAVIPSPRVMMTQGEPKRGADCSDVPRLASAMGLRLEDIAATGLPVQVSSTGLQQMMVPVSSLEAVRTMRPDMRALSELERAMGVTGFEVFTLDTKTDADVHVRFFVPGSGIDEDPATGSAAGALGAYLVRHRAVDTGRETVKLVVEQGEELQRPGRVEVEVGHANGEPKTVRVGGTCVTIMKGKILA